MPPEVLFCATDIPLNVPERLVRPASVSSGLFSLSFVIAAFHVLSFTKAERQDGEAVSAYAGSWTNLRLENASR